MIHLCTLTHKLHRYNNIVEVKENEIYKFYLLSVDWRLATFMLQILPEEEAYLDLGPIHPLRLQQFLLVSFAL